MPCQAGILFSITIDFRNCSEIFCANGIDRIARRGMKKGLTMAVVIWMLLTVMAVPVNAAETNTTVAGTVLKTDADLEVYQEASKTSKVIAVLDEGTVVLAIDETSEEGWCKISVKETTGYIKAGHLVTLGSSEEMDLEFEQIGNNYHMVFNEVQQLEKQQSQTRIWGTVIAVLTVGMFAAGIIPVIKKNRENEKNKM